MQKTYLFEFGNHPLLSEAEITARFPGLKKCKDTEPCISRNQKFEIFEGNEIKNPQKVLDTLGGTIRICEEIENRNGILPYATTDIAKILADFLLKNIPEGKINFGISTHQKKSMIVKPLLMETKKILKENKRNGRFLNRNFQNLDAGTLHKEGIQKENVVEFFIIEESPLDTCPERKLLCEKGNLGDLKVFHTLAAQNVEKFSQRDYEKPIRDMQVGMLPPKLALMMLNFSRQNGALPESIWDPFCGSGTILLEAGFLGIEPTGSDISKKMVSASKENWKYFFPKKNVHVFVQDAKQLLTFQKKFTPPSEGEERGKVTRINERINPNVPKADAIISEGFLGPIFSKPISEKELKRARHEVESVMETFVANIGKAFTGKRMVISLPFWKMKSGKNAFCEKTLAGIKRFWKNDLDVNFLTERKSLLFRRPNQVVGREIFVLEKKLRV